MLVLAGWEPAEAVDLLRERRSPNVLCNREFEQWVIEHGDSVRRRACA